MNRLFWWKVKREGGRGGDDDKGSEGERYSEIERDRERQREIQRDRGRQREIMGQKQKRIAIYKI